MYLIVDTETTGLPRDWKAPHTRIDNWPRIVQLAFVLYDATGALLAEYAELVKPDGFVIPADATRVHGITTERARADGVALADALTALEAAAAQARALVAHNLDFDAKVLRAEYVRTGMPTRIPQLAPVCTMRSSTDYCRLPGKYGFKWPSLQELYGRLFDADVIDGHDALVDARACARCFFELRKRGVLVA